MWRAGQKGRAQTVYICIFIHTKKISTTWVIKGLITHVKSKGNFLAKILEQNFFHLAQKYSYFFIKSTFYVSFKSSSLHLLAITMDVLHVNDNIVTTWLKHVHCRQTYSDTCTSTHNNMIIHFKTNQSTIISLFKAIYKLIVHWKIVHGYYKN